MYSVYQHWDPLKVCIVGRSYPPEFYSFIANNRARSVMERIAQETEEDYQKLVALLESFSVKVLRPNINPDVEYYTRQGKIFPPPMTPCDWTIMIGNTFYYNWYSELSIYKDIAAEHWPKINTMTEFSQLPTHIQDEVTQVAKNESTLLLSAGYKDIVAHVEQQGNPVVENMSIDYSINRAMTTRIGKDLYFGTEENKNLKEQHALKVSYSSMFPDYRCHIVNTNGHSDGTFCPVVPGLIVSLNEISTYAETFPGWEVVYLPEQSWGKVRPFLKLKKKNKGKWWVPGEELNDDFTEFVESWLTHWVGYVEETVFDVNMLVINEQNVVCNNYNKEVFAAFERHGVTPHIVNFRHRYFWDGGLHCITSDLHREGTVKDYFPERG
jgi:hypothetical protein